MLREIFLGRNPSHFHVNPIVKTFIVSELFVWSAMNFILPIFALFATSIPHGNIEIAATAYSIHLLVRVVFELISGRYFATVPDTKKILIIVFGMIIMSMAYFGFIFVNTLFTLYLYYSILGVGIGVISPVKNSLFSTHLDKNKEAVEWGLLDAVTLSFIALSSALGGFIAQKYGFQTLFFLAAIVNLIGILPYLLYIKGVQPSKIFFLRRG